MSESLVLTVTNLVQVAQVAVPMETVAEGEGESVCDFSLEEVSDDQLLIDAPPVDLPVIGQPPQDRLQMLIEDLSGITGALQEAPAQDAEAMVLPDAKVWSVDSGTRVAVVTAPRDPSHPVPIQAEPVPIQAEPGGAQIDPLLADSPLLQPPHASRDASPVPTDQPALPRIPLASVARQVAEAVVTARDDQIEVALAPEELGKIRMVMSGPEHSPHVMIWAERPEVLDQLRRNSAFLQECLRDAGMTDASFEFQGDTSAGSGGRQPQPDNAPPGFVVTESVPVPVAWTPTAIPARLDIRI